MKIIYKFTLALIFAILISLSAYPQYINHKIKANIDISTQTIEVIDSVGIPLKYLSKIKDTLVFTLNSNFTVKSMDPNIKISFLKAKKNSESSGIIENIYKVDFSKSNTSNLIIPIKYSGKVKDSIKQGAVEYARGFSETSGIICKEGVYLAGSTFWVPDFNDTMFSFDFTVSLDAAWGVVSQGTRTKNEIVNNKKIIRYQSPNPVDEIYLVAGKWSEYSKKCGDVLVQAVLRNPDSTSGYLDLYNKLIGKYPYSKFTLVENFWETGYGMPSFTLLGEKIIRLPFILYTSYPHELLHNYWGNSVYVDYAKGNWCEGITAYMADHLMKEQKGQGAEYRRVTLQHFTDYVNESNDFPLSEFVSRNNSAEEAIGYGKSLMLYEMLRYNFGDENFKKAISNFYIDNKFKMASFDDVQKSFEKETGQNLKEFFNQWLNRKGAPTIKLSDVILTETGGTYNLKFKLSQIQKEDTFKLLIPVYIYYNDTVVIKNVEMINRTQDFTFTYSKMPVKVEIDPQFNIFRRLDKDEVPFTISQIYGDKDAIMILPKNSPFIKEYTDLAEQWKQTQNVQGNKLEIKFDTDVQELPDKATWIIGFENKFAKDLNIFDNYANSLTSETLLQIDTLKKSGALVYVFPNQKNKLVSNGFLGSNNQKMITALKRKITHYTKYSYLGFAGDDALNKIKGEFPILSSPLNCYIKFNGKESKTTAVIKPRKALAY